MIDASCTKLYYPSPRLFGPRVFLEINGAKNQNARSAEDEERNEVVPPDGWGGFQPRYFISWIERRRGRGAGEEDERGGKKERKGREGRRETEKIRGWKGSPMNEEIQRK